MVTLPMRSDLSAYVMEVQLGDRSFRVGVQWNARDGFWSLELSTVLGVPLVSGLRLVPDQDLLGHLCDPRLPSGKLFSYDESGRGEPPGRDDLGQRVQLIFAPEGEL